MSEGDITLFYLADEERKWHRAKVEIKDEKLEVTAAGVKDPRGVAYGSMGVGTLPGIYNGAGRITSRAATV